MLERTQARAESPFEEEVIRHLVSRGYRVEPQVPVGGYRLDLVVGEPGNRVAVECDGDRFHGPEKLAEDMARQAILERVGWRFVRVRGSNFYRDPDPTMQTVRERLDALGVQPRSDSPDAGAASGELRDRVVRRAAEFRREWDMAEEKGEPRPAPFPSGNGGAPADVRSDSPPAVVQSQSGQGDLLTML